MSNQTRLPRFALRSGARQFAAGLIRLTKDVGARAWSNLWLSGGLIIVVVGLGVGLSIVLPWQFVPAPPPVTAALALEALDAGNLEAARVMADALRLQTDLDPRDQGTPSYILGVILAREIPTEWRRKERAGLHTLAIGYLEEARLRGYPRGRAAEAELMLGKLHFEKGQFAQSLPPLTAALAALPEQAATIHRYLADANLRCADPDWQQAQVHLEAFLRDPAAAAEARGRAEMDLARVYFERGNLAACDAVLSRVQEDAAEFPQALMLRGRVLIREADQLSPDLPAATTAAPAALEKYDEAAAIFEQLVTNIARNNDLVRQARYLWAICHLKQGKHATAEQQLLNLRRGNYNTPEGLASTLALGELQKAQGRDADAAATFRSAALQAGKTDPYENPWIPLSELRHRLEHAYQQFLDERQFERALAVADGLTPIVPPDRSVALSAAAERDWARHLELQATTAGLKEQDGLLAEAQAAWMRAGRLFERLARLRFSSRQFPDDVWNSADCYFRGHDYQRTVKLLNLFMENETRRRHPPALTLLGEAHLALGNPTEALKWLTDCIQFFPKDPYSYRARIVAAKANQELGDLDASQRLLIENLEHESLTPRSREWRESKFELGRVLYQQGVRHEARSRLKGVNDRNPAQRKQGLRELDLAGDAFQQAIEQLDEALRRDELAGRDPFETETLASHYFMADAHRQSAKSTRRKIATFPNDANHAEWAREMNKELNAAVAEFFALQEKLNRKQDQSELTAIELQLLRNCYFSRADALYDLREYAQARAAYFDATSRYPHEPESLEAYVQIANCYRHENRLAEVRQPLELAKRTLGKVREDADFNKTTRYTREEWAVLLDWLTEL